MNNFHWLRPLIARSARSGEAWPARRSSEGWTSSVRGAGRLPGSLRSPRVELSVGVHLPVEGWTDARIG